jgi:hypothetical protein
VRAWVAQRFTLNWQVGLTACLLGIGNGVLHWQAVDRPWRDYQAEEHVRVIAGTFIDPDQYRILTYALAEGLVRLGLPIHSAHEVWRVIFTSASMFVFYRFARGWFPPMLALMGMFMLAAAIPLTYIYYMMQVADPLNMLVFFLAFWAMRERRDRWLIPLVGIGMLNRESPAIIPFFYAAVNWGRPWRTWLPMAVGLFVLAVAVYVGLRVAYGPKTPCCTEGPLQRLLVNFTDWRAYVDTLGVLNIALWGSWLGWQRRPQFLRRTALMVPLFVAPYLLFGTVREARYYLPVLAVLIPMVLFYLLEVTGGEPLGTTELAREPASTRMTVAAPTMAARTSK